MSEGGRLLGSEADLNLQPGSKTQVRVTAFYDFLSYRSEVEWNPKKKGLGAGFSLEQLVHPRCKLQLNVEKRVVYDQYSGKFSWLFPTTRHDQLEFSLFGQYTTGDLPHPDDKRVGMMIAYRWNLPACSSTYLTSKTVQEVVLASVNSPLIRMPQTFVVRDQLILN